MRRITYLLLLLFLSVNLHGQDYSLPQVFSPNAAELGKYGKIPVSYFNGLPNIRIPLTELNAKGYTLPVYLTYHAGGNKPEQHPGWVGQGWSLHAGGSITRIINGTKDEMWGKEFYYGNNHYATDEVGYYYQCVSNNVLSSTWPSAVISSIINTADDRDYCPDEFCISTDDINASFYFTGENQIAIVSKDPVDFKVECEITAENSDYPGLFMFNNAEQPSNHLLAHRYHYFSRFKVTTSNGAVYIFGGDDSAIEYSITPVPFRRPSPSWYAVATANTWHLKEIIYPNGEHISFDYERDGIPMVRTDHHYGWSYGVIESESGNLPEQQGWTTVYDRNQMDSLHISYLMPSYLSVIRSQITRDSLVFHHSQSNELTYQTTDDEIRARVWRQTEYLDSATTKVIRQMRLKDKYQQLDNIESLHGTVSFNYTNDTTTRLKLLSITLPSSGHYYFEYNNTALPPYNSKQTDLWGYYNGVNYNHHFWEELETIRTPNAELMKAEILTRITYPTGGYTNLFYSPHEYSKVVSQYPFEISSNTPAIAGGLRINHIDDYDGTGQVNSRYFSYESSGILSGRHHNYAHGDYWFNEHNSQYVAHAVYSIFQESTLNELSTTTGCHVTYSKVIESESGRGSTHYYYANHDTPGCMDYASFYRENTFDGKVISEPFTSRELSRGNLLTVKKYDGQGRLVEEEYNTYSQDTLSSIISILSHSHCGNNLFGINGYKVFTYFPYLQQRQIKTYSDDGSYIVETTDYEYDNHRNLKKVTRTCGGHTEIQKTTYPEDIAGGIYPDMAEDSFLDKPVEQVVARDGKVVKASLITYKSVSGNYLPDECYQAAVGTNTLFSGYGYYNGQSLSPLYNREVTFSQYDSHGNPTLSFDKNGIPTTYIWDLRGNKLNAMFVGSVNGSHTYYARGAVPYTEMANYVNADPAEKTFTCEVGGSFSFAFTPVDTSVVLSAKLDGSVINIGRIGNGAQGTSSPITITTGSHTLQVSCISGNLILRGDGGEESRGRWVPIETFPLSGSLSITYPQYGAVGQGGTGTDCFFEDFESSAGTYTYGFESNCGRITPYNLSVLMVPNHPYILDYMRKENGKWHYVREVVTPTTRPYTKTIAASTSNPIDHVRFYPADNAVTSYTWYSTGELRCMVDGSGRVEKYEYDSLGRLTAVSDGDDNITKQYTYHYITDNNE